MDYARFLEDIQAQYGDKISRSIETSKVYKEFVDGVPSDKTQCECVLLPTDSVSGAMETAMGRTCILNFASYKRPGGGFLRGNTTQEESLCGVSTLYPVLKSFEQSYYNVNRLDLNRGMYTDKAIYSRDVVFFPTGHTPRDFDVLTCAAPNFSSGRRFGSVSREENYEYLAKRIRFIFDIAESEGVDCFVVGAWGCGAFKQDPGQVAKLLLNACNNTSIKRVVFAIPDADGKKFSAFDYVFKHSGLC